VSLGERKRRRFRWRRRSREVGKSFDELIERGLNDSSMIPKGTMRSDVGLSERGSRYRELKRERKSEVVVGKEVVVGQEHLPSVVGSVPCVYRMRVDVVLVRLDGVE
jgi:hypothetical protein